MAGETLQGAIVVVRLIDGRERPYEVVREDDEGKLELRPNTPAEREARKMGLVPATLEEFEAEYGPMLPPDDEP